MGLTDTLLIADDEGQRFIRDVQRACVRMRISMIRIKDELAVREMDYHPSSYRAIIIAHVCLPPCAPSTPAERLPNPKWHLQDPSATGIRVLDWIVADTKKLHIPTPLIFMGCHVAIMNTDVDHRANIRSRGGIPFYIDSTAPGDYTADGTLTIAGLINRLAEAT
jgi:hypothetical protein